MRKRILFFLSVLLMAAGLTGWGAPSWAFDETNDQDTITEQNVVLIQDEDESNAPYFFSMYASAGGSFLGVTTEEVTPEVVRRLKLKEERGALITSVLPDSAAAKAGLQKDDVIVRWNGAPVESASQLHRLIRETPSGRMVRLGVVRDGREIEMRVTLGKRSEHEPRQFRGLLDRETQERLREPFGKAREALENLDWGAYFGAFSGRGRMGITLQELTPQLADYFGVKDRTGVLISSVREDSPASRAGLKAGDVIIAIDGESVQDANDVIRVVAKKEQGPVEVRIVRERREMTVTVTLEKKEKAMPYFFGPEAGAVRFRAPHIRLFVPRIREIIPAPVRPLKQIGTPAGVI
ncbi:MAG: PDZ domain-containing protein [Blastocatellia bacterium]|nr:PDZ domain-containing protein [Blastocatellia bacterium]